MPNITLSVEVSRTALALSALQINDHETYYISGQEFFGSQVAWDRQTVSSPFLDGEVTVRRRRRNVMETVAVEVFGDTSAEVQTNTRALINAFSQDSYYITVSINGSSSVYLCETADYRITTGGPRYIANQLQVAFQVPRKPLVVSGSI